MANKKNIKTRGKIKFSEYFKELKNGEYVALKNEKGVVAGFPKRMQGRTGKVVGKQGQSYVVRVMDLNKEKTFIIRPVHLKRVEKSK